MEGDVRDDRCLRELADEYEPTHVIHLAARTDMDGCDLESYSANTRGVEVVVGICAEAACVERVVFASSRLVNPVGYSPRDLVEAHPDTWYGRSKAVGERFVRTHARARWSIVRPTSIWGPGFGVPYRQFFENIRRGTYVHPRKLEIMKSFGYVENTVSQLLSIALSEADGVDGSTSYLCDPPIELGSFADAIADASGVRRPRRVPVAALTLAAAGGDVGARLGRFGRAPLTSKRLRNLVTDMVLPEPEVDGRPLAGPVSLQLGLDRTVEWLDRAEIPGIEPIHR